MRTERVVTAHHSHFRRDQGGGAAVAAIQMCPGPVKGAEVRARLPCHPWLGVVTLAALAVAIGCPWWRKRRMPAGHTRLSLPPFLDLSTYSLPEVGPSISAHPFGGSKRFAERSSRACDPASLLPSRYAVPQPPLWPPGRPTAGPTVTGNSRQVAPGSPRPRSVPAVRVIGGYEHSCRKSFAGHLSPQGPLDPVRKTVPVDWFYRQDLVVGRCRRLSGVITM